MSKIIQIGITKLQHNPIEDVNSIEVVQGKGIKGDRKFRENNDSDSQLTLIVISIFQKNGNLDLDLVMI